MMLKRVASSPRTPDGYRLATFKEIRDKIWNELLLHGVVNDSQYYRVLDCIVSAGREDPTPINAFSKSLQMLIFKQSPADLSENCSGLLRNNLYSTIALDDEGRKAALSLACAVGDIEVISWLRHSSTPSQLSECFEKNESTGSHWPGVSLGKMILFEIPEIEESEMRKVLDYALECNASADYAIAVADIVLRPFPSQRKMYFVDNYIQKIAKEDQGEPKRTALFTKLLSESQHSPEDELLSIIKARFSKILSEACRRGYEELVDKLLELKRKELMMREHGALCGNIKLVSLPSPYPFTENSDREGRTPLHLAAREGHVEVVRSLLKYGADILERDMNGKTALHYAVTCRKGHGVAKELAKILMKHCESDEKRALLLWVSASGTGTAEETKDIGDPVKEYLKQQRCHLKHKNLIEEAAKAGNPKLAWEFLIRGGNTGEIGRMRPNERKQIERYMEQGMERPTLVDTLGRNALAECIAEHFLNSHIRSPINVSISGGSGMGKTSLMQQIKAYLQITTAQLTFPKLWKYEELSGKKICLSKKGETMLRQIEKGVMKIMDTKNDISYGSSKEKALVQFLSKYRPEYEAVYKSLACMDFAQLLEKNEGDSGYRFQGQSMGEAPRILTVDFNAGLYLGKYEAWAGLALEITRTIEDSMTWAQRLSTRWRNARTKHNTSFLLKFILPGFLLTFLAGWVAWAAWLLLDRTGNEGLKDLKYGSIPATITAIVWTVLSSATSIFKSVSSQMSEYFKVSDYSEQLSYQQNVISDIKFLINEIGKKPLFFFSFLTGEKCNNWFGLLKNNIENTSVPKYGSAPDSKLQIIAFVDDLDHCEDKAVLKVLWSINLVFRLCDINFILAVDKSTIQTAFKSSTGSQGEDSVDEYISKSIQLPVNLPDPEDDEWKAFLQEELGLQFGAEKDELEICNNAENDPPSSAEDTDPQQKHEEEREMSEYEGCIPNLQRQLKPSNGKSQDIEAGNNHPENRASSFFHKILSWIKSFLCMLYAFACNVRAEKVEYYCEESDLWSSNELSTRMLEVRGSLMLAYGEEEIKTFDKLRDFSAGKKKLPREWKRYIKYHKFAKNVILKKARKLKIFFPDPWQADFVAWTFVCLHWKAEMNILIKQWHKLMESCPHTVSLKEVVGMYKDEKTQSKTDAEEERERWDDLHACLDKVQNVTLKNLQIFQQFRFYRDARNLKIPNAEKNVAKQST